MRRLQGGSASTNKIAEYNSASGMGTSGPSLHMFHSKDLRVEFPKEDHKGVIMPAFADLNPADEAYATSVAPYRVAGTMDEERKTECFTSWYNQLKLYTFYGKSKCSFISCVEYIDDEGNHPWRWDPIMDVRNKIYKMTDSLDDNPLAHLVKGAKKNDIVWFPRAKDSMLVNVLCRPTYEKAKDKSERVHIMALSQMTWQKLLDDLDEGSRRSATKLVDENWPDYKLGDPTNPARPLQFTGRKTASDTGTAFTGLIFSDEKDKMGSDVVVADRLTKAQLAARYDLLDIENVLYIPTYEEQTDFLVEIKEIPYDLVREACEDTYNGQFPAKPKASTTYTAPEREETSKARSSGLAGKSYDDGDDIPYGDAEDDDAEQAVAAPEPEETGTKDEAPAAGIDTGTADIITEGLTDSTVNPDGLNAADWFAWADSLGFSKLAPRQLKLYIEMKKTGIK